MLTCANTIGGKLRLHLWQLTPVLDGIVWQAGDPFLEHKVPEQVEWAGRIEQPTGAAGPPLWQPTTLNSFGAPVLRFTLDWPPSHLNNSFLLKVPDVYDPQARTPNERVHTAVQAVPLHHHSPPANVFTPPQLQPRPFETTDQDGQQVLGRFLPCRL